MQVRFRPPLLLLCDVVPSYYIWNADFASEVKRRGSQGMEVYEMVFKNLAGILKIWLEVGNHIFTQHIIISLDQIFNF